MSTINIAQPQLTIDVVDNQPVINLAQQSITLDIESGGVVPAAIDTTLIASTNLSALRCITTDDNGKAKYATPDTLSNATVIGISTTAAAINENITVKTSGQITDSFWSFNKGPVFLGSNGSLTQTAPSGGLFIAYVGRAIAANTLIIDIDTIMETT